MNDTSDRFVKSTSHDAHMAWRSRFTTTTAILQRGGEAPFVPGRHLGTGGFGCVHETKLDGIAVALKRVWIRGAPRARDRAEFELLQKMAIARHVHVVEAIGLYILPGRPFSELGLLIWPVAQYDLARLLSHYEVLSAVHIRCLREHSLEYLTEEEQFVMEGLSVLTQNHWYKEVWSQVSKRPAVVETLLAHTSIYLKRVFGCIARAVQYLHKDQQIRHKDLKPSQVLLSSNGLWVTDFGWSVDITGLDDTATNNGDHTTARYLAPERERREECGRSEDVFGLGCIYLEMALALSQVSIADCLNPNGWESWSFHSNLDQLHNWLQMISGELAELCPLIYRMLARNPAGRPDISEVVNILCACQTTSKDTQYFGACCSADECCRLNNGASIA